MKRLCYLIPLFIFSILLSACQPAATPTHQWRPTSTRRPSVTISPTVLTSTPTLTFTPSPSHTPKPTATPYPPLAEEGPYLAYVSNEGDQQYLTLINADGSGLKRIPLPEGKCLSWEGGSLSPDGKWFAFYTGSAGQYDSYVCEDYPADHDLQLNLMNVATGEVTMITRLLGPDYPANISRIAPIILQNDPAWSWVSEEEVGEDPVEYVAHEINLLLINSLRNLDWSPDSKQIAFAGQMNGDTSDLYVYDLIDHSITQMTTGITQVVSIDWSPNGDYIINNATNTINNVDTVSDVYATKKDLSNQVYLGRYKNLETRWISPTILEINHLENVLGSHDIVFANIETGAVTNIWPASFSSDFAYDPDQGTLALFGGDEIPSEDTSLPYGLYLVNTNGTSKMLVEGYDRAIPLFLGATPHRFVVLSKGSFYSISLDGVMTAILPGKAGDFNNLSISPDNEWVIYSYENTFEIYNSNFELVRSVPDLDLGQIFSIFWRKDSQGAYVLTGPRLYYVPVPNGETILVDNHIWGHRYDNFFQWIP